MKRMLCVAMSLFCSLSLFGQKQITLEDIWSKGTFYYKGIYEIQSRNDGEHYCVLEKDGIAEYNYKNGERIGYRLKISDLSGSDKESLSNLSEYVFSKDENRLLLTTDAEYIYRRSYVANYFVYDLRDKKLSPLSNHGKQQLADFSPDGSKVAFVRDNNLFIKDLVTGEEKQITHDGQRNAIINGSTDWVYEEEFAIAKGFYWNATSDKIAYYKFDESKVKEAGMTIWGDLYPREYTFKYPKAGEDNSIVRIFVYDLKNNTHTPMDIGQETDIYIPRIQWTNSASDLCIHRLNRLQNHYELLLADANTGKSRLMYDETAKCYIEQPEEVAFLQDNEHFIMRSERSGYMHLQKVNMKNGSVKPITEGNFEVTDINYIDEKNKTIYYTSTESAPYNRDLYKIGFNGKKKQRLSGELGTYTAYFSANGEYYISSYSNAQRPPLYTINNKDGKVLKVLQDNRQTIERIRQYGEEHKEISSFVTERGDTLNYWIIKPSNMEKGRKYPILLFVYGGPGSQEVLNSCSRWSDYFWFRMLAQHGYVVVCVDNRGTGGRGEDFKKCTYLELGKLETEDQISAAKYFGSLDFIDASRIGIFGWSYGGYMSTLCITKGCDYFKTAIAVAPVTNWRYYDNIYTERFMRRPQENADGYDLNSPISHVEKLKGNYLLVHGSADDNVHLQNSMDLVSALVDADKPFDMFIYPNKNHSIYGGYTRLHLYRKMTDFLLKNL